MDMEALPNGRSRLGQGPRKPLPASREPANEGEPFGPM